MSANTIYLTADNFEEEVLKFPFRIGGFLCRLRGPASAWSRHRRIGRQVSGKAKICKLNIDEHRKVALSYKVMSIPTLFFFLRTRDKRELPEVCLLQYWKKTDALL